MMPLNSQLIPDPRRLRGSSPVVATKSEQAEEINATIDGIAKRGARSFRVSVLSLTAQQKKTQTR